GRRGVAVEQIPGPDEQALYCTAHARRTRGSARVHARVRPRARGRACARGHRRRARDLAVSLRRNPAAGRLRAKRAVLSAVLAALPALAPAPAAQGGRARAGNGGASAAPARRLAPAMAGRTRAGPLLPATARPDR